MGNSNPNHLFVNVVEPNNATATIGVKFGGWGNNLISTAIKTNAITMYSLLFIIYKYMFNYEEFKYCLWLNINLFKDTFRELTDIVAPDMAST